MWSWITSRTTAVGAAVLAGLALIAVLLTGARRAGRDAVRAESLERMMEAKNAADRAGAAFRADGAERRLRDGDF